MVGSLNNKVCINKPHQQQHEKEPQNLNLNEGGNLVHILNSIFEVIFFISNISKRTEIGELQEKEDGDSFKSDFRLSLCGQSYKKTDFTL